MRDSAKGSNGALGFKVSRFRMCNILKKLPSEVDGMSARDMDEFVIMDNEFSKIKNEEYKKLERRR